MIDRTQDPHEPTEGAVRVLQLTVFRRPDGTCFHALTYRLSMADVQRVLEDLAATVQASAPAIEASIRAAHDRN